MPVSCHFRDCKALLVTGLTHVSGAITSAQTFTFTFTFSTEPPLPSWKSIRRHIFAAGGPIRMKLGTLQKKPMPLTGSKCNSEVVLQYDGRLFLQSASSYISEIDWVISMVGWYFVAFPREQRHQITTGSKVSPLCRHLGNRYDIVIALTATRWSNLDKFGIPIRNEYRRR